MEDKENIFQNINATCSKIINISLSHPTLENTDHSSMTKFLNEYQKNEWIHNQMDDYQRELDELVNFQNDSAIDLDTEIEEKKEQIHEMTYERLLLDLIDSTLNKSYV